MFQADLEPCSTNKVLIVFVHHFLCFYRSRFGADGPFRALPPPPRAPPLFRPLHRCVTQNPPPHADPAALDQNGDAPRKSSQPCSPKKRLDSAVETDRVLTDALKDIEAGCAVGAAGAEADGGGGGGGPAPSGDEPAP